jgi:hypothetical protein
VTVRSTQVVRPSSDVSRLAALDGDGYSYGYEIVRRSEDARSAEEWARAVFEGAPKLLRSMIVAGWTFGLRLRLGSRHSPERILGWEVTSNEPTVVVLGVESWALTARLVVVVRDAQGLHATFVQYEHRLGRVMWSAAAPVHRLKIPVLLGHAANNGCRHD